MVRECGKCGNDTFDKGVLWMNKEVIRFGAESKRDPVLTAFLCKKCGNVELSVDEKAIEVSKFRSIDYAIEMGLTGEYIVGVNNYRDGDTLTMSFRELSIESKLPVNEISEIIPRYLERTEQKSPYIPNFGKITVKLVSDTTIEVAVIPSRR